MPAKVKTPKPGPDKKKKDKKDKAQQPALTETTADTPTETTAETATETTTETTAETATETTAENAAETNAEATPILTPTLMAIVHRAQADGQEAQAEEQETLSLTLRPPTKIEEQVKAAGFSRMGLGPATAEDSEERQLSDDRTAQILERSRIGTALFYVPILNPVWKVSCLEFSPIHNCGC